MLDIVVNQKAYGRDNMGCRITTLSNKKYFRLNLLPLLLMLTDEVSCERDVRGFLGKMFCLSNANKNFYSTIIFYKEMNGKIEK